MTYSSKTLISRAIGIFVILGAALLQGCGKHDNSVGSTSQPANQDLSKAVGGKMLFDILNLSTNQILTNIDSAEINIKVSEVIANRLAPVPDINALRTDNIYVNEQIYRNGKGQIEYLRVEEGVPTTLEILRLNLDPMWGAPYQAIEYAFGKSDDQLPANEFAQTAKTNSSPNYIQQHRRESKIQIFYTNAVNGLIGTVSVITNKTIQGICFGGVEQKPLGLTEAKYEYFAKSIKRVLERDKEHIDVYVYSKPEDTFIRLPGIPDYLENKTYRNERGEYFFDYRIKAAFPEDGITLGSADEAFQGLVFKKASASQVNSLVAARKKFNSATEVRQLQELRTAFASTANILVQQSLSTWQGIPRKITLSQTERYDTGGTLKQILPEITISCNVSIERTNLLFPLIIRKSNEFPGTAVSSGEQEEKLPNNFDLSSTPLGKAIAKAKLKFVSTHDGVKEELYFLENMVDARSVEGIYADSPDKELPWRLGVYVANVPDTVRLVFAYAETAPGRLVFRQVTNRQLTFSRSFNYNRNPHDSDGPHIVRTAMDMSANIQGGKMEIVQEEQFEQGRRSYSSNRKLVFDQTK